MKNTSVLLIGVSLLAGAAGFVLFAPGPRPARFAARPHRGARMKTATAMASGVRPGLTATITIRPCTPARSRSATSRTTTAMALSMMGLAARRRPWIQPRARARGILPDGKRSRGSGREAGSPGGWLGVRHGSLRSHQCPLSGVCERGCVCRACAGKFKCAGPLFDDPAFADYPVIHVSWKQATQFCAFAGGRLPSEAEWERAAAGSDAPRTYPWGESPPDCTKANFAGCVGDTDRAGRRVAGQSPYGAFDMAGNVWEWTADWYDAGYYSRSPRRDPVGRNSRTLKVMRGGCWISGKILCAPAAARPNCPI